MKMYLNDPKSSDARIGSSLETYSRKMKVFPTGVCPVIVHYTELMAAAYQTCRKCTPCRQGLPDLIALVKKVLDGEGSMETLEEMKRLAELIDETSDCAIGYDAAHIFRQELDQHWDDYVSHVEKNLCVQESQTVPCITLCPAHVDIPAYIALVNAQDYAGAVNKIREDNPLPTSCAMICEHPCEERCRRTLLDAPINIRGIKKYAVDQAPVDKIQVPKADVATGKRVAIIGGGPAGLTAAYFLGQMGHSVTIFEGKEKLGGMLRYGIPNYRFPKERLDEDINGILSAYDIEVKCNVQVGRDIPIQEVRNSYDAMFVGIGAQLGKTLRMEGADAGNVFSAVEMLDQVGHGQIPDYTGKTVVVIGGGNVAMDAARTALRCKADAVRIVYRRRRDDMTALDTEIDSAVTEGIDLITLEAPDHIEKDADGNCAALITQPQMTGAYRGGRPSPVKANKPPKRIPCQVILIAVGQDIDSKPFEEFGIPAKWNILQAGLDTAVADMPGVFTGGDCATGPSTAIRAIAAGKVAAYNIDEYLGYHHMPRHEVETPEPAANNRTQTGRVEIVERPAYIRKLDFDGVEEPMSFEEAMQESGRCLRCDHYGCGSMCGGRDGFFPGEHIDGGHVKNFK